MRFGMMALSAALRDCAAHAVRLRKGRPLTAPGACGAGHGPLLANVAGTATTASGTEPKHLGVLASWRGLAKCGCAKKQAKRDIESRPVVRQALAARQQSEYDQS
jgi:hypothetical protein